MKRIKGSIGIRSRLNTIRTHGPPCIRLVRIGPKAKPSPFLPVLVRLVIVLLNTTSRPALRAGTLAHCSVGLLQAAATGGLPWWLLALPWLQDRPTPWLTDMTDQQQIWGTKNACPWAKIKDRFKTNTVLLLKYEIGLNRCYSWPVIGALHTFLSTLLKQ